MPDQLVPHAAKCQLKRQPGMTVEAHPSSKVTSWCASTNEAPINASLAASTGSCFKPNQARLGRTSHPQCCGPLGSRKGFRPLVDWQHQQQDASCSRVSSSRFSSSRVSSSRVSSSSSSGMRQASRAGCRSVPRGVCCYTTCCVECHLLRPRQSSCLVVAAVQPRTNTLGSIACCMRKDRYHYHTHHSHSNSIVIYSLSQASLLAVLPSSYAVLPSENLLCEDHSTTLTSPGFTLQK
jgi:hypothetical protein